MKKFIGSIMAKIGAHLWENGGWTGDECYEDLKVTGKIGYNMFYKGLKLMDVDFEKLFNMTK